MIIANYIAFILLLIGGLNWGLIGLFGFNFVEFICMKNKTAERIIYTLVFIATIWLIISACIDSGILLK